LDGKELTLIHPEGQGEEGREVNKMKASVICHAASTWKEYSIGAFTVGEYGKDEHQTTPVRIPVIVINNLMSRKHFPQLSQNLEGLSLD
jgi:hypothetical protein